MRGTTSSISSGGGRACCFFGARIYCSGTYKKFSFLEFNKSLIKIELEELKAIIFKYTFKCNEFELYFAFLAADRIINKLPFSPWDFVDLGHWFFFGFSLDEATPSPFKSGFVVFFLDGRDFSIRAAGTFCSSSSSSSSLALAYSSWTLGIPTSLLMHRKWSLFHAGPVFAISKVFSSWFTTKSLQRAEPSRDLTPTLALSVQNKWIGILSQYVLCLP